MRSLPVNGVLALLCAAVLAACSEGDRPASSRTVSASAAANGFPLHTSRLAGGVPGPRQPAAVPGEFLVKFRIPASRIYAANTIQAAAFRIKASFRSVPGLHLVRAMTGVVAATAAQNLARQQDVEFVEPNYIVHAAAVPNDPSFSMQWALQNLGQNGGTVTTNPDIGAVTAWDTTTGSKDVVVAVIDTGVDYTHEDLVDNIFVNSSECVADGIDHDGNGYANDCHGINAITGSGDPMDDRFHGTHVAGIIGATGNNAIGVSGVNWNVSIMPCKFLDSSGSGTTADAITCLDYVAAMKDRGVNIVATNNSWGGGDYSQALGDAIVAQRQRGILFIAAAGNDGADNDQLPMYPCSFDLSNIICVAATYDSLSIFSNFGLGTVHLGAPGEYIYSTVPNNNYDTFDGTSMATPFVTGVIALLKAQDSTRDWRALKNLTLAGTVPPSQYGIPTVTGGRLNAAKALSCSNSVVQARMRPANFEPITLAIGGAIALEAININCSGPNGNVAVAVEPGSTAVTLTDDGTGSDEVAGDGIYTSTWTAPAAGTYTLTFPGRAADIVTVEVDPSLRAGFPLRMTQYPDYYGRVGAATTALVVGNIDGDSKPEILAPGVLYGPMYAWRGDGNPVPGWPIYIGDVAEMSLGEFDGNPASAEVAASAFSLADLQLFSGGGTPLPGWPQVTNNVWYPAPTADLDGDGRDEVIGYPARHADGSLVNQLMDIPVISPNGSGNTGPTAVADLDADGLLDLVDADLTNIYASNSIGLLAGFPVRTPDASSGATIYPVIGDVTGDGTPKIIIPSTPWSGSAGYLNVNILSNTGALIRTLPTTEPGTNSMVALGDLDGDGIPEIVTATGTHVYAWKGNGSAVPGWPVAIVSGALAGPVAIGDIDGDGKPDVVLLSATYINAGNPRAGLIHAYAHDGTPLANFPKPLKSIVWGTTPAIADLDGGGRNELIVNATPDWGARDSIFVYDLHGAGPYGAVEWGQYMGGPEHRGYYEIGKNLTGQAFLTAQAHGAGTIASSDGAINCGATCIHKYAKGSSVALTATALPGSAFSNWLGPCAGQGNPCMVAVNRYTAVAADFASPMGVSLTGSGTGTVTSAPGGLACPGNCNVQFPARSTVVLTAAPAPGSAFAGWSGACTDLSTTCTVIINGAHSLQARFVDRWQLKVTYTGGGSAHITSSSGGLDCGAICSADFAPGTVTTLTAIPADDTYIVDWGIPGCLNYQLTCDVTINADTTEVVALALKPTLALTIDGTGSVRFSTTDGRYFDCTASCTLPWDPGSLATLQAIPAADTYVDNWSGDCSGSGNICNLYIDSSKNMAVRFHPKPRVSVTLSGPGKGTVTASNGLLSCAPVCSDPVDPGAILTLTAVSATGSKFSGWSGACSGSLSSCDVLVTADTNVGAEFALNIGSGGGGGGSGSGGGGGGSMDWLALTILTLCTLRRARYATKMTAVG